MRVVVRSRVPAVTREGLANVEKGIRAATLEVEAQAKMRAPVDTGYLRNAIAGTARGTKGRVDSPAEYSLYQEMGTRYMGAHPFLIPALEATKAKMASFFKGLV